MNLSKVFFPTLLLATIVTGCFIDIDDDNDFFGNCVDGRGPIVSQEFNLPDIQGFDLEIPAKVYLKYGPTQSIVVEGRENVLNRIELDVNDRIWDIETDRCVENVGELKVFITLNDIRYLKISGSGEIVSENFLETDDLELYISGSGNMDLGIFSDDVESRITGSGTIKLEGTADDLEFVISGSGDYRAFDLEAQTAYIDIRGSGDAELFATDKLEVKISGSGDVFYIGNPILDVQISGSGRVIDSN